MSTQPKGLNDFQINGDIVTVYMHNSGKPMLCDLCMWNKLKQSTWSEHDGYAFAKIKRKVVAFHRLVMGSIPEGYVVDHINGDQFDNRKENLRITTQNVNILNQNKLHKNNTVGCHGVYRNRNGNRYYAKIRVKNKQIYLGTYDTIEEARKARKEGEIKYFSPIIKGETLHEV